MEPRRRRRPTPSQGCRGNAGGVGALGAGRKGSLPRSFGRPGPCHEGCGGEGSRCTPRPMLASRGWLYTSPPEDGKRWMDGWMDRMDGWMGWMDGWDGWDGWMNGGGGGGEREEEGLERPFFAAYDHVQTRRDTTGGRRCNFKSCIVLPSPPRRPPPRQFSSPSLPGEELLLIACVSFTPICFRVFISPRLFARAACIGIPYSNPCVRIDLSFPSVLSVKFLFLPPSLLLLSLSLSLCASVRVFLFLLRAGVWS